MRANTEGARGGTDNCLSDTSAVDRSYYTRCDDDLTILHTRTLEGRFEGTKESL
jgi:hypothetical protein